MLAIIGIRIAINLKKAFQINDSIRANNSVSYVEKLLGIALGDNRKFVISLILAPYFVNIQFLSIEDSYDRIRRWLIKCSNVRMLEPSMTHFDNLIVYSIDRAKKTGIKPLKLEETLRLKNKELYEILL